MSQTFTEGLLGRKLGMTQIFEAGGVVRPVTAIQAGPCTVTQVKTPDRDGYSAIQIGFGAAKKLNKPEAGHLRELPMLRHLREVRLDTVGSYEQGQQIDASLFEAGELVDVVGTSKGKGFAAPGSVGATTTPGRVYKGTRMAGHMGDVRVTVQNLKVVEVDTDRNLLLVEGAVPGADNGLVFVRKAVKAAGRKKQA